MNRIEKQLKSVRQDVARCEQYMLESKQELLRIRVNRDEVKDALHNLDNATHDLQFQLMNRLSHSKFIKYMQVNYGW